MSHPIRVELIDQVAPLAEHLVGASARRLAHLRYAEVRVEVAESRHGVGEDGAPRSSGDDVALAVGVRVLAGERAIAPGHAGRRFGAADARTFRKLLDDALATAYRRAYASAAHKAEARGKYGRSGRRWPTPFSTPYRPIGPGSRPSSRWTRAACPRPTWRHSRRGCRARCDPSRRGSSTIPSPCSPGCRASSSRRPRAPSSTSPLPSLRAAASRWRPAPTGARSCGTWSATSAAGRS